MNMRFWSGIIMILGGIALGAYLGIYVCLIGSIVDIINMANGTDPVSAPGVLWVIIKIAGAGVVGWGSALALIYPGTKLLFPKK